MTLRTVVLASIALALIVASCGGGDEDDNERPGEATVTVPADGGETTARPNVEEPTATFEEIVDDGGGTETDEDAEIRAAIEQPYDLISRERWEDLWNTYTSNFRDRCSFDAMVEVLKGLLATGVVRLEVSAFDEIEVLGDTAQASYSVVGFDDSGQQIASYNYETALVKEDGRWLAEEVCY